MQFNRVLTVFSSLAGVIRTPVTPRGFEIDLETLTQPTPAERAMMGLWVSDDGAMRLSLRPNGRYDKLLRDKRDTHRGRYEVDGSQLYFETDTGRTAIATARRGILTLGDHRFVRPASIRQDARSIA